MSSINKKHKYNLLFKSIDAAPSERGSSPGVSVSNRYTSSSMVQHSPRFLGLSEPQFRNPYNNIFDQVESPEIRSPSVVSALEPRTKLSVADLYKTDSGSSRSFTPSIPPLHLQKMPGGHDTVLKKRPQMRLKPVPKPPVASANVDSVVLSSPRKQKVKDINSSRIGIGLTKDNSVPNISSYLQYLDKNKESSNERRIKQKLGAPADPKTIKSAHESSALEHSPLLNMLSSLEVRSRMDSAMDMSLNLNNKDMKVNSIENVKDEKAASKTGESSPVKKSSSSGTLSKLSSMPFKIKTKFSFASQPDVQSLFKQIALNLHEVHKWNINERRFAHVIEVLADKNTEIVQIATAKWHKVYDYDPVKLEQKFGLIEVLYENLPITVKLQKKQQGIKLLDAALIGPLQIFNTKMEEYCVAKKTEALKLVEFGLEEAKFHLEEYGHKKASNLMKKGKVGEYYNMKMNYDNTLRLPYCTAAESDPTEEVEKYQRNHLDYKHIKRGNLEYSHNISEVFHEWSKYGMSYGNVCKDVYHCNEEALKSDIKWD